MPIDTKSILAKTFLEISRAKSIDKISVKELVLACGISRQAFYYHFQDIMEVAVYANELEIQKILAVSKDAETLEDALRIFITFFSDNLSVTRKQLESQKYRQFENLLTDMIRIYLKEIIKKSTCSYTPSELEDALNYATGGVFYMLMTSAGRSKESDDVLAGQLAMLIRGKLPLF